MDPILHEFSDNDFGAFASNEAGARRMSASSMSTPPTGLLSDYALIGSNSSPYFSHVTSRDGFALDLSVSQTSFLQEQPFPANTDAGGVPWEPTQAGIAPSSSYSRYQPLGVPNAMWQGPAPPIEYATSDTGIWEMAGYMPNEMDAPTPPFIPESQPATLTLGTLPLDVNVAPQTIFSYPSLTSSSPTPSSPQYHCFIDVEGIRWYQCMLCGKPIKERFANFLDHMKTHDRHRELFKCDWPGCDHPPFTRDRNRRRHFEKDHILSNPQFVASTTKSSNRRR